MDSERGDRLVQIIVLFIILGVFIIFTLIDDTIPQVEPSFLEKDTIIEPYQPYVLFTVNLERVFLPYIYKGNLYFCELDTCTQYNISSRKIKEITHNDTINFSQEEKIRFRRYGSDAVVGEEFTIKTHEGNWRSDLRVIYLLENNKPRREIRRNGNGKSFRLAYDNGKLFWAESEDGKTSFFMYVLPEKLVNKS